MSRSESETQTKNEPGESLRLSQMIATFDTALTHSEVENLVEITAVKV